MTKRIYCRFTKTILNAKTVILKQTFKSKIKILYLMKLSVKSYVNVNYIKDMFPFVDNYFFTVFVFTPVDIKLALIREKRQARL